MSVACDDPPDRAVVLHRQAAFTLIELLVVIALIAGLAVFMIAGFSGPSGNTAALRAAQAQLSGILTLARTKSIASGQSTRVLVNFSTTNSPGRPRFLRYVVAQSQAPADWQTFVEVYLPSGVYVVPGDFAGLPGGLFREGAAAWIRVDGSTPLRSSVLRSNQIRSEAVESTEVETWIGISISSTGSTAQAGDLVLALGHERQPGSFGSGESPVSLADPAAVRGLTLSSYGLAVLIDDGSSF